MEILNNNCIFVVRNNVSKLIQQFLSASALKWMNPFNDSNELVFLDTTRVGQVVGEEGQFVIYIFLSESKHLFGLMVFLNFWNTRNNLRAWNRCKNCIKNARKVFWVYSWISILRRTDYPNLDNTRNKAKLWQLLINFKGRKLFSRTKVIIIP